ncbi:class I SAM-dependent methyltransferase [Anatilimnocola floriformis]|uniref:class I SAM-dependent methyltransferase n=1 Tax=Anatilimnocola floriformis TaxID=2948575 RepID=UPI0020C48E74|nr:methyltransferase domain-containing protein [Anatilimnocola floriformis]
MSDHLHSQDKIWSHFQNADPESFAAAKPRLEYIVRSISRRVKSPKPKVLNIGVGSGHFEQTALARGFEVHSLDPDAVAIERLATAGVTGHVGYIEQMSLADKQFDAVVASEVLEHLHDAQRAAGLQEISRVLKPGGWFLGTVPYNENLKAGDVICPCCGTLFHRWGHQQTFTVASLRTQLEHQFAVRELRRTAFVPFRNRGPFGKLKSLARLLLARAGQMIAVPSLYWVAQSRG